MKKHGFYVLLSVILALFVLYGCPNTLFNNPPKISLVAPEDGSSVKPPVTLQWEMSDEDGDKLTVDVFVYEKDATPATVATLKDATSYIFEDAKPHATYEWYVKVSDGKDSVKSDVWSFTVGNRAPEWSVDKIEKFLEEGESTEVVLKDISYDKDNDELSYEFIGTYPSTIMSLEFDSSEGTVLKIVTTAESSGVYDAELAVIDSHNASDIISVHVVVGNVDVPPKWVNVEDLEANLEVDEKSAKTVDLSEYVEDPDEYDNPAEMSYKIVEGKKDWMEIEGATLKLMPGYDASGTYDIELKVTDGLGKSATTMVKVVVNNKNRPPEWVELISPQDEATDVSPMPKFEWEAYDPDVAEVGDDSLTYTLYLRREGEKDWEKFTADATSFELPEGSNLEYNAHYYWYVVAEDSEGSSLESDTWEFVTTDRGYVKLEITPTEVSSGNTFDLTVSIGNFKGLSGYFIRIPYDPKLFEVVKFDPDSGFGFSVSTDTIDNQPCITISGLTISPKDVNFESVETITFMVKKDVDGVMTERFTLMDGSRFLIKDGDVYEPVDPKVDDATVNILPVYYGELEVEPESTVMYEGDENTVTLNLTTSGTVVAVVITPEYDKDEFELEAPEGVQKADNGDYLLFYEDGKKFNGDELISFTLKATDNIVNPGVKEIKFDVKVGDKNNNLYKIGKATIKVDLRKKLYGEFKLTFPKKLHVGEKFSGVVSLENIVGTPCVMALNVNVKGVKEATFTKPESFTSEIWKITDIGEIIAGYDANSMGENVDLVDVDATAMEEVGEVIINVNGSVVDKNGREFQTKQATASIELYFGKISGDSTMVEYSTSTIRYAHFKLTELASKVKALTLKFDKGLMGVLSMEATNIDNEAYMMVVKTDPVPTVYVVFKEPIDEADIYVPYVTAATPPDYVNIPFSAEVVTVDKETYPLTVENPFKIWVTNDGK